MVTTQLLVAEFLTAVHAQVLVTAKQDSIAQGGFFRLGVVEFPVTGDDTVQFNF